MNRHSQSAFTLVEVMVALFVFSILAAASYSTLGATVESARAVSDQMLRLQALQRTMQTLQLDFSQLHPRPVRRELADAPSGALLADERGDYLVELTRAGYANPLVLPRSSLQRVAYYLDEEKLIRVQWPVLDRTLGSEPVEILFMDGVEEFTIRYLPETGDWVDRWPPSGEPNAATVRLRPRAVEIVMITAEYGEMRRLIEVIG